MQRVPVNDVRRHSSTVTVAFVDDSETDFVLDDGEVEITSYRGSGPGGQHRNTSDTGVRAKHLPTGIVAKADNSRSWWQNRQAAMAELGRRVEADLKASADADRNAARVEQIGLGDRASHEWTWTAWRDQAVDHSTGKRYKMSAALKGRL